MLVDLRYAYDLYIGPQAGPSRDAYLRLNGRPLIFIFPKNAGTNWNQVRQAVDNWPMPDKPLLIYKDFDGHYNDAFDGFYAWVSPGKGGWAPDGSKWGEDYLRDYYSFTGPFAEKIAAGLLTTPQAIAQFLRGYEEAGCDELVLFPTVPDLTQVDQLADILRGLGRDY